MTRPLNHFMKILVADDDPFVCQIIQKRLELKGYTVTTACTGLESLHSFQADSPDLVILDIRLPLLNGFDVLRNIRAQSNIPVILLSGVSSIGTKVEGLRLGADDYILKPFSIRELEARLRAVSRRAYEAKETKITEVTNIHAALLIGSLSIDFCKCRAFRDEQPLLLTRMEFRILETLYISKGKPVSREKLLRTLWSDEGNSSEARRLVDSHISRLRRKIGINPEDPEVILTCHGIGYMLGSTNSGGGEARSLKLLSETTDPAAWKAQQWGLPQPEA
jgi:OmpR family response regulator RpaB